MSRPPVLDGGIDVSTDIGFRMARVTDFYVITIYDTLGRHETCNVCPRMYPNGGVMSDDRQTVTFFEPEHVYYRAPNLDREGEAPAYCCKCGPKVHQPETHGG